MNDEKELSEQEKGLLLQAMNGMKNACVKWGFAVGAAVLAEDNKTYLGCNVETMISGLGVCAERCAIDHAVLHGNKKIIKIAIVANDKHVKVLRPCGACLQYIHDFSVKDDNGHPNTKVIMAKVHDWKIVKHTVEEKSITELLPHPFEAKST